MQVTAKQSVEQSLSSVKTTANVLKQAINYIQRQDDKNSILEIINTLDTAQSQLSQYKD